MVIGLLALLVAGTSPGSSTPEITNASFERTLPSPKPRHRKSPVQRAFERVEAKRDAYFEIDVVLTQRSLKKKTDAAEALAAEYAGVIRLGDPKYSLAAWVRIAEIYLHFAEQIRAASGIDRGELEAMALGPEQRARQAIDQGLAHARRRNVRGVWRARLDELQRSDFAREPAK